MKRRHGSEWAYSARPVVQTRRHPTRLACSSSGGADLSACQASRDLLALLGPRQHGIAACSRILRSVALGRKSVCATARFRGRHGGAFDTSTHTSRAKPMNHAELSNRPVAAGMSIESNE